MSIGTSLTSITDLRIRRHLMIYDVTLQYLFRGKEKFVRPEALATWAFAEPARTQEENGAGVITRTRCTRPSRSGHFRPRDYFSSRSPAPTQSALPPG